MNEKIRKDPVVVFELTKLIQGEDNEKQNNETETMHRGRENTQRKSCAISI